MVNIIQQLIHWIHYHPHCASILIFLIAFTESIALIGFFIPGSTILMMFGGLIGAHILPPTAILIAAVVGAISGDSVSYWLGSRYHQLIRSSWPCCHFTSLFNKSELFFIKHGGKSVFLGRFLGPLRCIIPFIAGMMKLKIARFILSNMLSALIWAPGYIILGIIIGKQLAIVSPHHTEKIIAEITVIVLAIWVLYCLVRKIILHYIFTLKQQSKQSWQNIHHSLLKNLLYGKHKPLVKRQGWLAVGMFTSSIAFLILFAFIMLYPNIESINLPLHYLLLSLHSPIPDGFMITVTQLGEKIILLPVVALIWLYFIQQKQNRLAWHWLALMLITISAITLFKQLARYPRPTDLVITISEYSFPSGHVSMAVVFWGFLAFVFGQQSIKLKHRYWLGATASLIIIAVTFSRLYLGMHWLTDVMGSLLLGLSCLSLVILSYCRKPFAAHTLSLQPLAILLITSFIVLTSLFLQRHFVHQYHSFQSVAEHTFIFST